MHVIDFSVERMNKIDENLSKLNIVLHIIQLLHCTQRCVCIYAMVRVGV